MKQFASALALAAFSCNATAEWVMVDDHDDYVAYADPATISRQGNLVRMSDLIDLKSPRPSPHGKQHASSTAQSEFDCQNSQIRTIAFSLHSGQMGNGDLVETAAASRNWLPIAAGTLLNILWQFACNPA